MPNLKIVLTCAALLNAAPLACMAGDIRIEVRGETHAPAKLWVAPIATEKDDKTWGVYGILCKRSFVNSVTSALRTGS